MLADISEALRRGDTETALKLARKAVAAEPENADAHHLLGLGLQRIRDLAGARGAFQRAVELAPDRADHLFALANITLDLGDPPAAIRLLHEVLSLDPNKLVAYILLGQLARGRGDRVEAERNLKLAERLDPNHPQVLLLNGYLALEAGNAERAMRCFTEVVKLVPRLGAAHYGLGMAYLANNHWFFAEQALANALALESPRSPGTLRAMVEALRRQGKQVETLQALEELIATAPADKADLRGLRAELLVNAGRGEAAMADLRGLLDENPTEPKTVRRATALMAVAGFREEAIARAEAALDKFPTDEALWMARLNLASVIVEDPKPLFDRWLKILPGSAVCNDLLVGYHASRGDYAKSLAHAEQALATEPKMINSRIAKVRAEVADNPRQALQTAAEGFALAEQDPRQQRILLAWTGLARDALGEYGEAASQWRQMLQIPLSLLPPPGFAPAEDAPAGEIGGTLLWSPPGVRVETLLNSLHDELGLRLELGRIGTAVHPDGFGAARLPPGHADAGSAERWRKARAARKIDPDTAVDWLPHVDGYTFAALSGARVVGLLMDPRDAFLNWMVHGSLQGYAFSPNPQKSAEWLALGLEALADHRDQHPDRVHLVRLDRDAGKAGALVEQALGLKQPLKAIQGAGDSFPPGRWKEYREAFKDEFARLAPVAARLGYPDA